MNGSQQRFSPFIQRQERDAFAQRSWNGDFLRSRVCSKHLLGFLAFDVVVILVMKRGQFNWIYHTRSVPITNTSPYLSRFHAIFIQKKATKGTQRGCLRFLRAILLIFQGETPPHRTNLRRHHIDLRRIPGPQFLHSK
ncbi:hypothetical protein RJT34_18190 [Clitoria ternatea]|uniref:Uncharacterized protein n=1 Tax=Clitoria ternatea TaxID=43366 RepID=A0AAN9JDH0_CLITE